MSTSKKATPKKKAATKTVAKTHRPNSTTPLTDEQEQQGVESASDPAAVDSGAIPTNTGTDDAASIADVVQHKQG